MKIRRAIASLGIAATCPAMAVPALAQGTVREDYTVTSRRNFDGSYTTKDSDGYSVTTRRNFDGGVTTKDNEGNSTTCRPFYYGGQVQCRYVRVRPGPGPATDASGELAEPQEEPEPPAPSDD
ncbi:MAG: hypothetical protein QM690_21435 [Sphingobium sp.]